MEQLCEEMQRMFQQFREELQEPLTTQRQTRRRQDHTPDSNQGQSSSPEREQHMDDLPWRELLQDLPLAPQLQPASISKIFKLAKEVKRRAQVITSGRDLHDIHTVLYLIGHWEFLEPIAQHYAAHRLRLLYVAITKGWPAALYYDQQGPDEFLDTEPQFWASYQPPRSRAVQQRTGRARGKSSTRRTRGRPQQQQ
jgi:hypothetical protein